MYFDQAADPEPERDPQETSLEALEPVECRFESVEDWEEAHG
jgi:hypothetical protein